ncbi:hypothetical protein MRX96_030520 [Rhipicephalus microplus]
MAKTASSPLLICGDVNASHTQCGYGIDSPKGKRLAELMDELGLVLLNEPASHTQIGQGAVARRQISSFGQTRAQSPGRTPLRIWEATTESCA